MTEPARTPGTFQPDPPLPGPPVGERSPSPRSEDPAVHNPVVYNPGAPSPVGPSPVGTNPGVHNPVVHSPKVAFQTLGCRLNQAESEQALEALRARGFDPARAGECPDVVVVNTCTVTAESTASSRRLIRQTAEANPQATVVVTGCYAVADPEAVRAIPGVDLVVGNDDKDRLAELV